MALFSEEWLTLIEMLGKETSFKSWGYNRTLIILHRKKGSLSDWSLHGGSQYFEMACPEFITACVALFITTVFTSMNIHDETTRLESGWNCKTD